MKKLTKILKVAFTVWGILSLLAVIALACYLLRQDYFGDGKPREAQTDFANSEDAQQVLDLGHLDKNQQYKIEHSYRAARSFIGERCETIAIRLESFPEDLLKEDTFADAPIWAPGPPTNPIFAKAIDSACSNVKRYGPKWFPDAKDLKSDKFYICFRRMIVEPQSISSVRILAYDRQDKILYYVNSDE